MNRIDFPFRWKKIPGMGYSNTAFFYHSLGYPKEQFAFYVWKSLQFL